MLIIMDDALIKYKNLIAAWIDNENKSILGFFKRKEYVFNIDYIADNDGRLVYTRECSSYEEAKKLLDEVLIQVKAQQ